MIKKICFSAASVFLCIAMLFCAASCGYDEFNTNPTHPSTQQISSTSATDKTTALLTSPSSEILTDLESTAAESKNSTQRFSFVYTGQYVQKSTIPANVSYLKGYNGMRDVTATQIVADMQLGVSFGNSLEIATSSYTTSIDVDITRGNPRISKKLIDSVKADGFNAIRLPINWGSHLDPETNTLNSDWLNRIQETTEMVLNSGMYCIITMHSEQSWLSTKSSKFTSAWVKFINIWKQIAERFKNYDDYLIFEGYSEVLKTAKDWSNPTQTDVNNINTLAKGFVSAIRRSGGNNEVRHLIVDTYGSLYNSSELNNLRIPIDSAKNKIIAGVHLYAPPEFIGDTSISTKKTWGTEAERKALNSQLYLIYNKLTKTQGVPVIISEFTASDKNNDASRSIYASFFVRTAYKYGMACIWWDDGNVHRLYNRYTGELDFPTVAMSMVSSIR